MASINHTKRVLAELVLALFVISMALKLYSGISLPYALIDTILSALQVEYVGIGINYSSLALVFASKIIDAAILPLLTLLLATIFLDAINNVSIIEGVRRSMTKRLHNHVIVAPFNSLALHLGAEMKKAGIDAVVVAKSSAEFNRAQEEGINCIIGEIKDAESFKAAGIAHALCVVSCSNIDMQNALISITAKSVFPEVKIISTVNNAENVDKLLKSGAMSVVQPEAIAGIEAAFVISSNTNTLKTSHARTKRRGRVFRG